MNVLVRMAVRVFLIVWVAGFTAASVSAESPDLVDKAKRFRQLIAEGEWGEARKMMAADPRRWFEEREGEGSEWTVGPKSGPWANWDEEFGSTSTVVGWSSDERSATARILEINDYYRLLERGAVTSEITYFFDSAGRIEGLLIRAVGERPAGRTNEFLRWALDNEPRELRELMPKGSVDPSGDHPERFRALLERWRRAAGLPDLSLSDEVPPTPSVASPSGLEEELRAVSEQFVRGWLENDPTAVMSTLSADAVLLPHHGVQPLQGEKEIREFWFPDDGSAARVTTFEQTYDEMGGDGGIGFTRGRFVLEFESGGSTYRNEGNYLMLFRRNEQGEWSITHRIWNDPIPTR